VKLELRHTIYLPWPRAEQLVYALLRDGQVMIGQGYSETEGRVRKTVEELAWKFAAEWQNDNS
jgi:hypothetical protein